MLLSADICFGEIGWCSSERGGLCAELRLHTIDSPPTRSTRYLLETISISFRQCTQIQAHLYDISTPSASMMTSPITNVALLGTGLYARSDYIPALLSETAQNVHVHTIWSLDEAAANECATELSKNGTRPRVLAQKDDIEVILQDKEIDAIIMVLPFMYQPDLIRRAWKAGKHVLSEKPVERDVEAGMALVREFDKEWAPKGLVWRVAEGTWHPITFRSSSRPSSTAFVLVLIICNRLRP